LSDERVKHHNHRASSPLYTLTLSIVSRVCAGGAPSWRGRPPCASCCASWAAPAPAAMPAAEVCPNARRRGRRITHALEFPNSSVCVISKQFHLAEVTTRANTDKKARSKQRTRKAIVPLSTADDVRDDTYDDDNIRSRRRRLRRRRRRCLRGRPTDLAAQEGEGIR